VSNRYDDDPRWYQLGEVLVHHSTRVRPGERVMIAMGELCSFPLARGVVEAVVKAGGYPQLQFLSEQLRHAILEHGDADQLAWVPEIEVYGMQWADVYIALRGGYDLSVHDDVPADRLAVNQAAQGRVSSLRWQQTRWSLVRVPDENVAAQAGCPLEDLLEMFFRACLLDWDEQVRTWQGWVEQLAGSRQVQIVGHETDLAFSVKGRAWIASPGATNMPDGEIMTAPVTETIDGTILFEHPAVLGGRLVHDLRLTWERGTLAAVSSSTEQDFVRTILATDPGATLIGEFGLGTNPYVDRFSNDILLDEKIGGTCHIALGRAYPECGGTNISAIHWDIVKDIRKQGAVIVDGRPVLREGAFAF
jgi:aminopeptidase